LLFVSLARAGVLRYDARPHGEVAEWSKAHAWKVCIRQRIEGSNPSLSAIGLDDVADAAALILTGKNGTGKSLILEAIVFAWAARYSDRDRVGPWG
jgi:hypothetical protein